MDDRALLERLIGGPCSGDHLAREFGLTRAAVWKRMAALREAGIEIAAQRGSGYRLHAPVELLDADQIRAAVPASAQPEALEIAWSIDSTNSELLRRPASAAGTSVLLAERQTGGRGRRGRTWASPLATHIYLSCARTFSGGLARLGGLSLVAGIAAAEALQRLGVAVQLKWPNDLVVGGPGGLRKLGGVLVEGGGEHAGPVRAVIGLGVNVRMPAAVAASIDQPWCDLASLLPEPPSRNAVAAALVGALLPAFDRFDAEGFAPFRERYTALDALADCPIRVSGAGADRSGIALGLAEDGGLRVQWDAGGEGVLHSGEVSVRGVTS